MEGRQMNDPQVLKRLGHQPCTHVEHIQGTDSEVWRCPQCRETYRCSQRAYCPKCVEDASTRAERLSHLRNRRSRINEEIELLEALEEDDKELSKALEDKDDGSSS
jgi:hypothetical protein